MSSTIQGPGTPPTRERTSAPAARPAPDGGKPPIVHSDEDVMLWCAMQGDYSMPPPDWIPPPRDKRPVSFDYVPSGVAAPAPSQSTWSRPPSSGPAVSTPYAPTSPSAAAPAPSSPPSAPRVSSAPARSDAPKPIIAILDTQSGNAAGTPVYIGGGNREKYAAAVRDSGGEVRWLTNDGRDAEAQLEGVHGVLIPGGRDIHPSLYGQKETSKLNLGAIEFDLWQCGMVEKAMAMRIPTRGICRGMQMMNVAARGTLMQDIHDHMDRPWNYRIDHVSGQHPVVIMPSSALGTQLKTELVTLKSSHHQAIDRLGEGFQPSAHAADGVVEAIEMEDNPTILGVQFHPERASFDVKNRFFGAFVQDAQKYRTRLEAPPPAAETGPAAEAADTSIASTPVAPSAHATDSSTVGTPPGGAHRPVVLAANHARTAQASDAPRPVEQRPAPAVQKTLREHLQAGIDQLAKQEVEIIGASDVFAETGFDPKAICMLRSRGAASAYESIPRGRLHEYLLSLTKEGRQALPGPVADGIAAANRLRQRHNEKYIGDLFSRKTGWFSTARVNTALEAVWAAQDGKLIMTVLHKAANYSEETRFANLAALCNAAEK